MKYFSKAHGFIYSLLRDSEYGKLHNKPGYKYFCFSNIFPIGDMSSGEERSFIISSPDRFMINTMKEKLESMERINIGEMSFSIEQIKLLKCNIKNNPALISATPIVIRIPKTNYDRYCIISNKKYVFWRPEYSFEVFVKQLEENLFKKYKEFYKINIEEFPLFEQFKFIKPCVNHVVINGVERMFVGSVWEFIFTGLKYDKERRKILEFGLDCGFGERNTYGFGFMNLKRS